MGAECPTSGEHSELTYEGAVARLEALVRDLENGALSLDHSLAAYSEAVGLSRHCASLLEKAEKELKFLSEEGAPLPAPTDLREPDLPG